MNFLQRLERRFSWLAVENLPLYMVGASALVAAFEYTHPGFSAWLILDPSAVLAGQLWRLLTFIFVPPEMNPLFMFFWLYLLYIYGTALEQEWGSFPFTLFYYLGIASHIVTAFLIVKGPVLNFYLNLSLFLAFAALFPDMELLIFFILPVKVKYLAILSWLWILWSLFTSSGVTGLAIFVNISNYLIFFGPQHIRWVRLKWEVMNNRRRFK